jgi:TolB protein
MTDIETRLQRTFRDHLDPIGVPGTLPRDIRVRARAGRAAGIALVALATVAVVAIAAVAVPNVLDRDSDQVPTGPSPSPYPITPKKNGLITYSSNGKRGIELHSIQPDGSDDRVIPIPSGDPWLPAWSPDGSKLAVAVFAGGGRRSLLVMDTDFTDAQQVASAENVGTPSWSPDGRSLLYAAKNGEQTEIHLVGADGSGDVVIHQEPAEGTYAIFSAQFSPDGTQILFDRGTDVGFDIFVMDTDGRNVRRLTSTGTDYDPSWSPDGTRIAFTRQEIVNNRATSDIFLMNADGSDVRRLTDDGTGTSLHPEWSPDGTRIAYSRTHNTGQSVGPPGLVIMKADGSDKTVLVEGDVYGHAWQPEPEEGAVVNDGGEVFQYEIPVDRYGCPDNPATTGHEWGGDPSLIADGSDGDTPWILCARIASQVEGEKEGDAICINFARGGWDNAGWDCYFAHGEPYALDGDLFAPVLSSDFGGFIGVVPSDTAQVSFEPARGPTVTGDVYPAPEELSVPFQFFTLFVNTEATGWFVARDAENALICRWSTNGPMEGPRCPF